MYLKLQNKCKRVEKAIHLLAHFHTEVEQSEIKRLQASGSFSPTRVRENLLTLTTL
jgi:hypothetical protein